jgi:sec-independent protein translocase protein TatA
MFHVMSAIHLPTLAFIQGLGWTEVVVVLFLILLLFGAKRLPELARGFGKSIKEFKKATTEIEDDIRSAIEDEPRKTPPVQMKPAEPKVETPPDPPAEKAKIE